VKPFAVKRLKHGRKNRVGLVTGVFTPPPAAGLPRLTRGYRTVEIVLLVGIKTMWILILLVDEILNYLLFFLTISSKECSIRSIYLSEPQRGDILVAPAAGRGEIGLWVYRQHWAVQKEKGAPRRQDGFGSGSITIYLPAAGWRFETCRLVIVLLVAIKIGVTMIFANN